MDKITYSVSEFKSLLKKEKRRVTKRPEQELQIRCVSWFRDKFPDVLAFHPAGERKSRGFTNKKGQFIPVETVYLRRMGQLPGIGDMLIFHRKMIGGLPIFLALSIEFKSDSGVQSEHQKKFQVQWEAWGGKYYIIRTFEDFCQTVNNYMQ